MSEPLLSIAGARPPGPSVQEGRLIGALLCRDLGDPRDLLALSGLIEADIRDTRYQWAWRMISQLADRGAPVSFATVHSRGQSLGLFNNTDATWLGSLEAANGLDRDQFAQIAGDLRRGILGRAVAGKLKEIARQLEGGSYAVAQVSADLDQASSNLARSDVRGQTAATDIQEQAASWEHHEKHGTRPGILTRIKMIDQVTAAPGGVGGAPPQFGVICGRPSVGKNIFLAGMIRAQLEAEPDLLIGACFLEQGSAWCIRRWTAMDLGIPLSAVGVVRRTDEQRERMAVLEPHYHELLKRVLVYRHRRIRPAEMLHTMRMWIHEGVREIVLDDFNHIDYRPSPYAQRQFGNEKRNEQVAEAAEGMAELADRKRIPIIATAHTVKSESERDLYRPPRLDEIFDSTGIGKVARFGIGLWRTRSNALRATILKNTEGPGRDETVELEAQAEAAMLEVDGGRLINLDQENREEKANRDAASMDARIALSIEMRKKKDAILAKEKAEAAANAPAPEPAPQLDLLGGAKP